MKLVLIVGLLGYSILMLAQTIVAESIAAALLFGVLVLVLGNALCKATNWMNEETENDTD